MTRWQNNFGCIFMILLRSISPFVNDSISWNFVTMRPSTLSLRRFATLRRIPGTCSTQTRLQSSLSRRPFSLDRRILPSSRHPFAPFKRYESSIVPQDRSPQKPNGRDEPAYELTFTCKPCLHRSSHRVTKQGYHHGTVLISCPQCKNRHVISDHLRIFMDEKSTLEDILARKGDDLTKLLKKGKLGIRQDSQVGNEGEEDIEFWEDGTETRRQPDP